MSSSPPGWLKVFAMKHGVVGIRGVKSALYLCMNGEGLAYATVWSSHQYHTSITPVPHQYHTSMTASLCQTCTRVTVRATSSLSTGLHHVKCLPASSPSRSSFLTTACWRSTWKRITTPPTPLCLTPASIWLSPTRECSGRAPVWAATRPAPTSSLGESRDHDSGPIRNVSYRLDTGLHTGPQHGNTGTGSTCRRYYWWDYLL